MKTLITATFASILLFGLSLGLPARPAAACMRVPETRSPQQMVDRADAVFTGKVMGVNKAQVRLRNYEQGQAVYREGQAVLFDVTAVWKGSSQSQIIVGAGYGMCDPIFRVGESYLVYASGPAAELSTDEDIPIELAVKDDLLPLGRGVSPAHSVSLTLPGAPFPEQANIAPMAKYEEPIKFQYIVVGITIVAILVTGGFLMFHNWKEQFN